jgi:serine/threonine-protein kinase
MDLAHPVAGDVVNGWRILHPWHQDSWSLFFAVERQEERRLLRMPRLRPDSPEGREQEQFLEREASALRFFQHPSQPRVHEDGRWPEPDTGRRYLVLDVSEAELLSHWALAGATLPQLVEVLRHLSGLVLDMHAQGLVHGDVRADNILVRKEDTRPLLINFLHATWPGQPSPQGGTPPTEAEDLSSLQWLFGPPERSRRR